MGMRYERCEIMRVREDILWVETNWRSSTQSYCASICQSWGSKRVLKIVKLKCVTMCRCWGLAWALIMQQMKVRSQRQNWKVIKKRIIRVIIWNFIGVVCVLWASGWVGRVVYLGWFTAVVEKPPSWKNHVFPLEILRRDHVAQFCNFLGWLGEHQRERSMSHDSSFPHELTPYDNIFHHLHIAEKKSQVKSSISFIAQSHAHPTLYVHSVAIRPSPECKLGINLM